MTHRIGRFAVAGLAAVLAVVVGCRSARKPADPITALQGKVNTEVSAVVKDSERATQVEALTQQVLDVLRQVKQKDSEYRARRGALNADYDATPQQFSELSAAQRSALNALLKQSIEIRGRIASLLTDEEWKKLNDLRADIRTLGITIN